MGNSVQVKCNYCDRNTIYSHEAIVAEIKRLKTYNYEILTCIHCSRKFSKYDFEKALGLFKFEDITKIMNENVNISLPKTSTLYNESEEDLQERLKRFNDEKLKQDEILQDEIKKMQAGEPYDERIVGPVEMENGTPQDRNCVRILKKEGELYAYTFNAIDYVFTSIWEFILSIGHIIWDIIKKINWCIVCSILRIGYFISYIGLIIYGIIATFILHEAIFNEDYLDLIKSSSISTMPNYIWTLTIIILCTIPLFIQILWAFKTPDSRWARVIKKRANEIIK